MIELPSPLFFSATVTFEVIFRAIETTSSTLAHSPSLRAPSTKTYFSDSS